MVKVDPRGTSREFVYDNPLRDWISANRTKRHGWDGSELPAEMGPH